MKPTKPARLTPSPKVCCMISLSDIIFGRRRLGTGPLSRLEPRQCSCELISAKVQLRDKISSQLVSTWPIADTR